ncbi:Putative pre-16S rRNA nuclease Yqg [hydrothermal vent metagenome]|uniref:Pre-16S rRNA nuclease Yqg n=1 Tax=hydrothermal vent metagenome TaxID=652676 RepID=A0A3B0ZIE0_9ZZZZ
MSDSEASQPLLGFDYGRRRIGVAVGQRLTRSATPLTTVRARDGKPDWPSVTHLIEEWKPGALVVGIPYHMDGTEQDMTHAAKKFCRQLEGRYRLPVHQAEERLSSWVVESRLSAREQANTDIDAMSAQVILQDWLQQEPNN